MVKSDHILFWHFENTIYSSYFLIKLHKRHSRHETDTSRLIFLAAAAPASFRHPSSDRPETSSNWALSKKKEPFVGGRQLLLIEPRRAAQSAVAVFEPKPRFQMR